MRQMDLKMITLLPIHPIIRYILMILPSRQKLVNYIQGLEHVRKVNQSEQASRTLGSINKLVSYVSIAVIAILLIISIFLISNTVSMGISVRKEEIGIMKYIGATDAFVRLPFLLEGMILGVIGAAIPLICLFSCIIPL